MSARRVRLPGRLPAASAALLVAGERDAFALTGTWAGVAAIVGAAPLRVLGAREDPFAALDAQPELDAASDPGVVVGGGWFGALGYALHGRVEPATPGPPRGLALPAAPLAFHDHVLVCDHKGGWWFEALHTPGRETVLRERLDELAARLAAAPRARPARLRDVRTRAPGAAGHRAAVAECKERIAAGELFQANLAIHLDATLEGRPADLAVAAAARLAAPHGALVQGPWGALVSASPELFLRRVGLAVRTSPIKGTAPEEPGASGTPGRVGAPAASAVRTAPVWSAAAAPVASASAASAASAAVAPVAPASSPPAAPVASAPGSSTAARGLATSAKDRAENVMIVDLMRNDLGRVCEFGSVVVGALAEPAAGAGVIHLVSEVAGTLRPEVGNAELLRATFPPGSVTGAPKLQALRVIAELEGTARQVYTGAIGYASPIAGLELSVAIRTFELVGTRVQLGVGGGITAASDPDGELEECLVKARPLLALGGATAPPGDHARRGGESGVPATASALSRVPRALANGRERPDPARGIFDTLAVRDGEAVLLAAHLRRLHAAAQALGTSLPDDLRSRVETAAARLGSGRLRVDLDRDGCAALSTGAFPVAAGPIVLAPWLLPGGLGAHKWADRRLIDALGAASGAAPLLLDADGAVLEAGWASVWIEEGGRLLTPPDDGRILSGVTRAQLLAIDPRCGVDGLTLERLEQADALWVSSALRGLVPAVLAAR